MGLLSRMWSYSCGLVIICFNLYHQQFRFMSWFQDWGESILRAKKKMERFDFCKGNNHRHWEFQGIRWGKGEASGRNFCIIGQAVMLLTAIVSQSSNLSSNQGFLLVTIPYHYNGLYLCIMITRISHNLNKRLRPFSFLRQQKLDKDFKEKS